MLHLEVKLRGRPISLLRHSGRAGRRPRIRCAHAAPSYIPDGVAKIRLWRSRSI